jgi:hypothetical protein
MFLGKMLLKINRAWASEIECDKKSAAKLVATILELSSLPAPSSVQQNVLRGASSLPPHFVQ